MQIQLQGLLEHEFCLGHGPFKGVHHQDHAVHHLKDTLYLAAEIGMAWRVDDIDLYTFIKYCGILRKDRDTALSLNVIGVHDALHHFLVGAEHAALAQKLIHQSGLAVVYMGNDRYVSDILAFDLHKTPLS